MKENENKLKEELDTVKENENNLKEELDIVKKEFKEMRIN